MTNTNEHLIEEELKELEANVEEINEEINSYIPKLIGSHIYTGRYGRGTIESIDNGLMHVDFGGVTKEYAYPLPSTTTMRFDAESRKYWNKIIELSEKVETWKKDIIRIQIDLNTIRSSKNELNNTKEFRNVQWDAMNVIIKATYNDGGRNRTQCGFCGVCSDETIKYNIKTKKRRWCSNKNSFCSMYLNGELTRENLEDAMDRDGYVCYESRMLRDYTVEAGIKRFKLDGNEKAVSIQNAGRGKLCVLTTIEPWKKTEDAIVFGMFIIGKVYAGNEDTAGELSADSRFRLKFSPQEARQFNLWDHYFNRNSPDKKEWGSGLLRYATDDMAVSFLKKAIELKRGTKDEKKAIEMYEFFCEENGIIPDTET